MHKNQVTRICLSFVLLALGLNLSLAQAYLKEIVINDDCLIGGGTALGIATLSEPAEADKSVTLLSNDARIVVPASVEIPQGESEGYFEIGVSFSASTYSGSVYGSLDNWMQKAKIAQVPDATVFAISTFTATQGSGSNWLNWSGQEENIFGSSVAGYFVQRKTNKGDFEDLTFVPSTSASYVDNLAEDGNNYIYRIQLRDSAGTVLATSPERSISYSGGAPTITWIDPPVDPVSGVIHLNANNPDPSQLVYSLYIDGVPANSGASDREPSAILTSVLDTRTLENGYHLLWLASSGDSENLLSSTPILLEVNNTIIRANTDIFAEINSLDFPELFIAFSETVASYSVAIMSGAQEVRSWTGSGGDARVSWDGRNNLGSVVPDGIYTLLITSDHGTYEEYIHKSNSPPQFLGIVTYDNSFALEKAYVTQLLGYVQSMSSQYGFNFAVIGINESKTLSKAFSDRLVRWLRTSVVFLYIYGHGRIEKPDAFGNYQEHFAVLGANTFLYNTDFANNDFQKISAFRANQFRRAYRFAWIDTCHSAGKKRSVDPIDEFLAHGTNGSKMTRTPNAWSKWREALNIQQGIIMGNNGLSTRYGNNPPMRSRAWMWHRWAVLFWDFLARGNAETSAAIDYATRNLPSFSEQYAPTPRSFSSRLGQRKFFYLGEYIW